MNKHRLKVWANEKAPGYNIFHPIWIKTNKTMDDNTAITDVYASVLLRHNCLGLAQQNHDNHSV